MPTLAPSTAASSVTAADYDDDDGEEEEDDDAEMSRFSDYFDPTGPRTKEIATVVAQPRHTSPQEGAIMV